MQSSDCIFCRIASGEVPTDIVYRSDDVVVFRDIQPRAPVHLLVVPIEHIARLADVTADKANLLGHLLLTCTMIAREQGIAERGYRVIINSGPDSGQIVPHLHFHILGGRPLAGMG